MNLIKIKRDGKELPQSFLRSSEKSEIDLSFSSNDIIKDDRPSVVARINNNQQIIKLVRPWKWHDRFKLLWGSSCIQKEIKGNQALRNLNIKVPEIIESGLSINSLRGNEFIGYYIMENLTKRGYQEALTILQSGVLDEAEKETIFSECYRDLETMRDNKLIFTDLSMRNMFINKDGNIVWIDTGINQYSGLTNKTFTRKFNQSIDRLLNSYSRFLSEDKIGMLKSLQI